MGEQGVFKLDMDRFFIYGPEPTGIWTGFDNRPEIRFGIRPGGVFKLDNRPEIRFGIRPGGVFNVDATGDSCKLET